jgi:diguanylate cyclase (GGDEF)-like protein
MSLDVPTLFIVSTCIVALLGMFLFYAWIQDRSVHALVWWGAAYLVGGVGVALWMFDDVATLLPYGFSNGLLFVACGMIWNGARLFHGRPVLLIPLSAGGVIWLVACQFPLLTQSGNNRVVLSSLIVSAYTFITARELWRERRKPGRSQWPAIFVPVLHGMVFLPPIPLAFLTPGAQAASLLSNGWMAVFTLQMLLYVVGTAFIVLIMANERAEHLHKTAAVTDVLTGLLNRRGFFEHAQVLIRRLSAKGGRITVLMFDLDHFKSINDRFGHAVGDDALRLFAATIQANMRPGDIIGRLGGEEFAVLLPCVLTEAAAVAERLRAAFEIAGVEISGHRMGATVSIGAAEAGAPDCDMELLLGRADGALYRAKSNGRNRLEAADALLGGAPSIVPDAPIHDATADGRNAVLPEPALADSVDAIADRQFHDAAVAAAGDRIPPEDWTKPGCNASFTFEAQHRTNVSAAKLCPPPRRLPRARSQYRAGGAGARMRLFNLR